MSEENQNNQSDFMIEKIKERPINKKKLMRRTIITAAMAVIFGLIACLTFLILEPVFSNWLYPEEDPQVIVFPEDQEEMSPEEMLADNMQQEKQQEEKEETQPESVTMEAEKLQEILAQVPLSLEKYQQLYDILSDYRSELEQCMVTVMGVTSNIDWFNNVQESEGRTFGVIIANNGRELLILTDYGAIRDAESLTLTFHNNTQTKAEIKQYDENTNLAVLSVNLIQLSSEMIKDEIKIATLGSSNVANLIGMPVVALGNPMGSHGSVSYGIITSANDQASMADANYKLLTTDIYGSQNASGVLFNLQGQVVGVITDNYNSTDMKNIITAYAITDLKKVIEKMSNGSPVASLGITGVDVSKEAHDELSVPYGAYVKEVKMDSPAMLAGIQQGDVVVGIEEWKIKSFGDYATVILQLEAGQSVKVTVMRQTQDEYKEMSFDIVCGEA